LLDRAGRSPEELSGNLKKIIRGDFTDAERRELDSSFPGWRTVSLEYAYKAKVLEHKGILVSDPMLCDMNATRWAFEIEALNLAEEQRIEEQKTMFDIVKTSLIQLLGLNLMPVEDGENGYRLPKDHEVIPLSVWVGSGGELLKEALERNKQYLDQVRLESEVGESLRKPEAELTPEEFDDLFDGDISFDDETLARPDWESDEAKAIRRQMIKLLPESTKPVVIETDSETQPKLRKSSVVVIESD
jgi:hypothetical protein